MDWKPFKTISSNMEYCRNDMVFWRASSKKKKKSLKTILYAIVCISKMNSNLYGRNKNDPLCVALVLVQLRVNGYFLRIPHEACYKWIWEYLLRSRPLYEFNKDRCFVLFIDRNMQARGSGLLGWSEKRQHFTSMKNGWMIPNFASVGWCL